MKARIYKPGKDATQSGRGRTDQWYLQYELETARTPDPLMGWPTSGDTMNQPSIPFETLEDAEKFAKSQGVSYVVLPERPRRVKPKNYGDNFK